jgi:hypothetical protein
MVWEKKHILGQPLVTFINLTIKTKKEDNKRLEK